MRSTQPPFEYLITSSEPALESFQLARLAQAANFRKELRQVMGDWIEAEAEARLARWILDCRRAQSSDCSPGGSHGAEPVISGTLENEILPPTDALSFVPRASPALHAPLGQAESRAETSAFGARLPRQNRPERRRTDAPLLAAPLFPEDAAAATNSHDSDARPAKKRKTARNAGAPPSGAAIASLFPETPLEPLRSDRANRDWCAAPRASGCVRDPSPSRMQSKILRADAASVGIAGLHRALHTAGPVRANFRQLVLYRHGRANRR
jgi:hypothetical protein